MEEQSGAKKRKSNDLYSIVGIILVLAAVVLLIWFLLKGQTTVEGGFPDPEKTTSISCKASSSFLYPFFKYDNSNGKSTEINATFENDELRKIALIVMMNYGSVEEIEQSEANNHAAMNFSFADAGLGPDAFSSNYARLSSGLKYSISNGADDLYKGGTKYFLLEELNTSPFKMEDVMSALKKKGFTCEQNS